MGKTDEVIFDLIKKEKNRNGGFVYEKRIVKMATLLNIHPDAYEKIKQRLVQTGKIQSQGPKIFLP
jgi:hypothetical protein